MKRRLALIVPVVVALIAVGAMLATRPIPHAHARGGGWVFQPSGSVDLPVGYCAFPVHSDTLADNSYQRQATQADGTTVYTFHGTLKYRLTNKNTGKSIDLNVSGPGEAYAHPDGSLYVVFHGTTVNIFDTTAQQEFGLPGIAYTTGLFTYTYAPEGSVTAYSSNGTTTDVCAELS
jgi:hypothetical protein